MTPPLQSGTKVLDLGLESGQVGLACPLVVSLIMFLPQTMVHTCPIVLGSCLLVVVLLLLPDGMPRLTLLPSLGKAARVSAAGRMGLPTLGISALSSKPDGTEDLLFKSRGCLELELPDWAPPPSKADTPPVSVSPVSDTPPVSDTASKLDTTSAPDSEPGAAATLEPSVDWSSSSALPCCRVLMSWSCSSRRMSAWTRALRTAGRLKVLSGTAEVRSVDEVLPEVIRSLTTSMTCSDSDISKLK